MTMSTSGNYAAYIRDVGETDQLVVVDLHTFDARIIQSAPANAGQLRWVAFKSDDRLIFGTRHIAGLGGSLETGSRLRGVAALNFSVWRVFAIDRDGRNRVEMFGEQSRQLAHGIGSTFMVDTLPGDAENILLTATDNSGLGVWRANVSSGRVERVANGDFDTFDYTTDGAGYPVIRIDSISNGAGYRIYRRGNGERGWTVYRDVRRVAVTTNSPDFNVLGPGPGAAQVYVLARPDDRDLLALYLFDTATGQLSAPLQESPEADVAPPWINVATREIYARCEYVQRPHCSSSDRSVDRHLRAVEQFLGDGVNATLINISADGSKWLLYASGPTEAGAYYLYDRATASMEALAQAYPGLSNASLSPTQVVPYQSRDGAQLWAYVTARPGVVGPRPTILLPHGGPEWRDQFDFDAFAQFLASRGYVVIQPNFRGSIGFGRAFGDAGRGQWGLRMQDDVTDALRHMIDAGVTDPQRVCIVGMSYGGYAALAGVTLTPDLYRCAISVAGVSDLIESLRDERGESTGQSASYQYWRRSMGDPRENRDALIAASPARLADRVRVPVLLVHGSADTTVPFGQSELMQQALQRAGKASRLIRIEDEGHSWYGWSPENRMTLFRETEAFLAQNLGPAN